MIHTLTDLFQQPAFGLRQNDKEAMLLPLLCALTTHHRDKCDAYRRITDVTAPDFAQAQTLADLPYLPISLFKHRRLRSIPAQDVRTTVKSSGTTGTGVSQIDLDPDNARLSSRALNCIMRSVTGNERWPMLIIDCPAALHNQQGLGARASAILGLMPQGRDPCFALNDDFSLATERVAAFLQKNAGSKILIYGFTFIIWQFFLPQCAHKGFDLSNGILLHSGGWKKLQDSAVSPQDFKARLKQAAGITRVMNFYGMAELPGTIFLENADGLLSVPSFADVIIRDPVTFLPLPNGQTGLIQILSLLPHSYPGHSLLTEDMGLIESVDSGIDGRWGKNIKIMGRAPRASLRGCSDVLAAKIEGGT